ncbi:MAG: hypothetical protein ABMA02_07115 [Saprospiraceae bacterium]
MFFILILTALASNAQPQDIRSFVSAAADARREIGLLLPAVQKVEEAAIFVPVIEAARKLAAKTQQAGSGMPNTQYEALQRELAQVEADLVRLLGVKKAPGACPKACSDALGTGLGGGKGWNRFICKLGCIPIHIQRQ